MKQWTHKKAAMRLATMFAFAIILLSSVFTSPPATSAKAHKTTLRQAGAISHVVINHEFSTLQSPKNKSLAATPANLHQTRTWYVGVVGGLDRYKMRIKNMGGTATGAFTY